MLLRLLIVIAILIIFFLFILVVTFRRKLWGLLVLTIGGAGTIHFSLRRFYYLNMAENPGFIWKDPNGLPYSTLYNYKAEDQIPWIVLSAAVALTGLILLTVELIKRRKK